MRKFVATPPCDRRHRPAEDRNEKKASISPFARVPPGPLRGFPFALQFGPASAARLFGPRGSRRQKGRLPPRRNLGRWKNPRATARDFREPCPPSPGRWGRRAGRRSCRLDPIAWRPRRCVPPALRIRRHARMPKPRELGSRPPYIELTPWCTRTAPRGHPQEFFEGRPGASKHHQPHRHHRYCRKLRRLGPTPPGRHPRLPALRPPFPISAERGHRSSVRA